MRGYAWATRHFLMAPRPTMTYTGLSPVPCPLSARTDATTEPRTHPRRRFHGALGFRRHARRVGAAHDD